MEEPETFVAELGAVAVDTAAAAGLAALLTPFVDSSGRLVDVPSTVAAESRDLLPGDLARERLNRSSRL